MSAPSLWNRYDGPMDDASAATFNLLRGLNVAAAPGSVAGYVTAHPAYPSLAAMIDGLAEFGVRASARRIGPEGLSSVAVPALVHVRDAAAAGAFWLISDHSGGRFECRLPSGKVEWLTEAELVARYLGIVVSAVAAPDAGERYATRHERADRMRARLPHVAVALFAVAFGTVCAAASGVPAGSAGNALGLSLTGFVGLGLTLYLSLRERLDGTSLLARLCPTGKTFNCASVVGSTAGYVAGVVPLADVGAAFFIAELVAFTVAALAGLTNAFFAGLMLLGAALVPVIVYSLVQQAVVLRRWCTLCLLVDGVLGVQLALAARATRLDLHAVGGVGARDAVLLLGSAVAAALAYAVARPLVTPALAAPRLHAELESFRSMPEVFAATLTRMPVVATDLPGKVLEGDPAAPMELLLVSHPFCVACADAHTAVERLCEAFPRLVRTATVFSVSSEDRAAAGAACALLAGTRELGDWYSNVEDNVEEWLRSPRSAPAEEQLTVLAAQRAFAEREAALDTPAIFVDGRRLPPGFALRHLRFFLRAEQRRLRAAGLSARESA